MSSILHSNDSSSNLPKNGELITFEEAGRYGFYSPQGEKIDITDIADRLTGGGFSNGLIEFEKNKKVGLLSAQGKVILPPEYVYIEAQSSGLIWANRTNDAFWSTDVYHEEWMGSYLENGIERSPCEFSFLDYTITDHDGKVLYETPFVLKVPHSNLLGMGNEFSINSSVVFNETGDAIRIYDLNESMVSNQDINGLWGIKSSGELVEAAPYFFPPEAFYWGKYENEPLIPVIEWNQELSYILEYA